MTVEYGDLIKNYKNMKIYVKKIDGVTLPQKGSELAAGYDIVATSEPKIVGQLETAPGIENRGYRHIDYIEYETNLFIAPSVLTYHTLIHPRSSISKYNLILANSIGLVDNDYRGMILCRFKYIWQPNDFWTSGNALVGKPQSSKIYQKGDVIAQLVFEPTIQVEWELVDDLSKTQRSEGGFGSTDKNIIPITKKSADVIATTTIEKTEIAVKDHKTSTSPLLEKYRGSAADVPKPTANYETAIKERERQIP